MSPAPGSGLVSPLTEAPVVRHGCPYLDSRRGRARDIRTMMLALAYAAMGVTAATIPAALPSVAAFAGVGAEHLLPGISLLFGALLVGVLGVSALHRVAPRRYLAAGSLLQATGLVIIAVGRSEVSFLVACSVAGLGFGLAEASANLLTRLLAAEKTATELAGMTAMTALAAAVCPLVLALNAGTQAGFALALGCLALLPVTAALAVAYRWRGPTSADEDDQPTATRRPGTLRGLAIIAVGLFLFVGVETVMSGWSSVLPQQMLDLEPHIAALGTSGFWILMAVGRGAARVVGSRTGGAPYLVVTLGLGAAALGVAAALGDADPRLGLVVAGIATVLLAPGYSLILGIALAAVDVDTARRVTGVLVAIGSAGGSLIPLAVIALVGARPAGSLALASALLLAAVVGSLLHVAHRRRSVIQEAS